MRLRGRCQSLRREPICIDSIQRLYNMNGCGHQVYAHGKGCGSSADKYLLTDSPALLVAVREAVVRCDTAAPSRLAHGLRGM